MVVGCRLGANLFPHCQMVKRVVGKRERGKKGSPLDDDDAHATYGGELGGAALWQSSAKRYKR